MKYDLGWEYNRKNNPYYGKSMSNNFPGSPHTMGFVEYSWEPISQALPILWVLLSFPMLWEIDEKTHAFPCDEVYHRMRIQWEKNTHTMKKYEYQ